jgi:hypothetical protein
MSRTSRPVLAALAAALLAALGCAGGPRPIQAPSATGSLIYGSIDLPDEVADQIHWLHIYKVGEVYVPPFKTPIQARVFANGDFYAENVSPGKYFVHHIAAGFEAFYFYAGKMSDVERTALAHTVDVSAGSLTYLGRYRIHDWKPGAQSKLSPRIGSARMLSSPPQSGPTPIPNFMGEKGAWSAAAGIFAMERTQKPSDERRLLDHILEEVTGTGWEQRIEPRRRSLR